MGDGGQSDLSSQLHPLIAAWCWRQGWTSLRPIQARALAAFGAASSSNVPDAVISAATAGGKTEAAFLPLLSRIAGAEVAGQGFDILYIAPIKALINDQTGRLEAMGRDAGIEVFPWHGDAPAGAKARAMRRPTGCLLITPESLESMLMRRSREVPRLFGRLTAIVVDELHAFIGDPRGRQLQSVLHRIDSLCGRTPARIGLSATLADMRLAAEFLRPGAGAKAVLIEAKSDGRELLLGVKAAIDGDQQAREPSAIDLICRDIFERMRGRRNLLFASSRGIVELLADTLSQRCLAEGLPDEFTAHHGSLSKAHRADVERRMRDANLPLTITCTSTLEMGLDIGHIETIGQVGPPSSISGMKQRLGRSGRRDDKPAIMRVWTPLPRLSPSSHPLDLLRLPLIRAIAMCQLMLEGWIEPPRAGAIDLSTLLHQVLALIVERHGVKAGKAYEVLCQKGPFRECAGPMFSDLLRAMGRTKLIEQAPDGDLLLGPKGEELSQDRSFYAVFKTPLDWTIINDAKVVGTIPAEEQLMAPGICIVLGGRRWRVDTVDEQSRQAFVKPSRKGKPPRFAGEAGVIHREIPRRMRRVLEGSDVPAFLDPVAREELQAAREVFQELDQSPIQLLWWNGATTILHWEGTVEANTLALRLMAESGMSLEASTHAIEVEGITPDEIRKELQRIAAGAELRSCVDLAKLASDLMRAKFDGFIDPDLLARAYAVTRLDDGWRPNAGCAERPASIRFGGGEGSPAEEIALDEEDQTPEDPGGEGSPVEWFADA